MIKDLLTVTFVRHSSGGEVNHDIALFVHCEGSGLVDGSIIRQRLIILNRKVDYLRCLFHPVFHLHGNGVHQIGLVIHPAEGLQGSIFFRGRV